MSSGEGAREDRARAAVGLHELGPHGDEGEDEGESEDETEVMIKFCGKDALKKAHELLMGSGKPYGK